MEDDNTRALGNVIRIDDDRLKGHLDRTVRGTVKETLNAMLVRKPSGWLGRAAMSATKNGEIIARATTSGSCRPRRARSR